MAEEIVLSGPKTTLQEDLTRLYSQGFLTDITLSTEDGKNFEAHRILLAARSHYFHSIVPRLKSEPVIFLKGVKGAHLDKILKYIYSGSVSLSRHQLKPILEVAKSLQVKGLYDANPADILSRQGLTGPSPAAVQAMASRAGGNPAVIAAMTARAQQRQMVSPSAASNEKPGPSGSVSNNKTNANKSRYLMTSIRRDEDEDDSDSDDEIIMNKTKQESEDEDDDEDEDDNDEVGEEKKASPAKNKSVVRPRKRRGRPPKNVKSKKPNPSPTGDSKSTDPYDFDADDAGPSQMRASGDEKGKQQWRLGGATKKSKEGEDEDNLGAKRDRTNKYSPSAIINGKQILAVKCKNQTAELHLSRFANGIRGNSIKFKEQWMTPQEFEDACGTSNNKYLENIQTDYGPLKTLTASGMLKPHSRKCRCTVCRGEEISPKGDKIKSKKRSKNDEEEGGEEEEDIDDQNKSAAEEHEEQDQSSQTNHATAEDEDQQQSHHHTKDKDRGKRKKKKHLRDEWRKQLLAEQLKQEAVNASNNIQQQQHHQALAAQPNTITIMDDGGNTFEQQQPQMHHVQIQPPQGGHEIFVTNISAINPTMVSTISDMPPKISTPSVLQNRIEPPQHAQPPTFYVMSPHPHMTAAPPTPQHNPFAASMGPPPPASPAPSLTSQMSSPAMSSMQKSQNGLKLDSTSGGSNASTPTSSSISTPPNVSTPRMGPVMNVRCKSTTALMYTTKYESGSKGKCIQLGDEWLTPNEFEDRAGSKAKKYLSSIKCLGRPLRVFVNSGELKGSGPPPAPKIQKKVKPSPMQPIAPAPAPGTSGMLTPGPQIGQIATAPPTPSHISSAPPIPANLNMVMGGHNQPPILINQTSMASTIMGNQMMPITYAISAPIDPMDVRQNVSQAM